MGKDKKPTKDQHYVPQVYLRGFSPDSKEMVDKDKMRIFRLPLHRIIDGNANVPIQSQAYVKYLYEVYDNEDRMVSVNYIENCLCDLENEFGRRVTRMLDKLESGNISKITDEERDFWESYISLQMVRTHEVIEAAKTFTENIFSGWMSKQESAALVMLKLFPFFSDITDIESVGEDIVSLHRKKLKDRIMCFGIDSNDSIFTSDKPVCGFVDNWESLNISGVIFPITSNCVLCFFNPATTPKEWDNSIFYLSEEAIQYIKKCIVVNAKTCLYSKSSFQEDELEFIYNVRNGVEKVEGLEYKNWDHHAITKEVE